MRIGAGTAFGQESRKRNRKGKDSRKAGPWNLYDSALTRPEPFRFGGLFALSQGGFDLGRTHARHAGGLACQREGLQPGPFRLRALFGHVRDGQRPGPLCQYRMRFQRPAFPFGHAAQLQFVHFVKKDSIWQKIAGLLGRDRQFFLQKYKSPVKNQLPKWFCFSRTAFSLLSSRWRVRLVDWQNVPLCTWCIGYCCFAKVQ